MNDGYDIPSPDNIGGLWLGERLLALRKNYFYIHRCLSSGYSVVSGRVPLSSSISSLMGSSFDQTVGQLGSY